MLFFYAKLGFETIHYDNVDTHYYVIKEKDAGEWEKYTGTNALRSVAENADGSWNVKYTITLKHSEDEPEFRIAETKVPENYVASNEGARPAAVEVNVPKNYSVSYDTSFYKTVVITNTYGEEPGNPETGAPIMRTVCETIVPMEIFLPKKREDEE
ncbi:MAG: hypothetical protein IJO01_00105 [Oscillospiraceae bacterium]|nr:hypothetical protein [Oscillospiraceae bacterium]